MKASVTLDGVTETFPAFITWQDGGFHVHFTVPGQGVTGKALRRIHRRVRKSGTYIFSLLANEHQVIPPVVVDVSVPDRPFRGGAFFLAQPVVLTPERPAP